MHLDTEQGNQKRSRVLVQYGQRNVASLPLAETWVNLDLDRFLTDSRRAATLQPNHDEMNLRARS
jgi:hypothetical protein